MEKNIYHAKMMLLIADISGYTEFIKYHKAEITYSESLIQQLILSIMQSDIAPFVVNKLEGDALLMYCDSENFDDPKAVKNLIDKSHHIYTVFEAEKEKIYPLCRCHPCLSLPNLKIKVIFHFGDVSLLKMGNFTELSGIEVIRIHRLLKNPIEEREYLLLTESVYNLIKNDFEDINPKSIAVYDNTLGETKGYVFPLSKRIE